MGELQNLETLDIRGTNVKEMPKEICKLRKLRHLLGNKLKLFQMKNGLEGMASLQTLCHVNMYDDDDDDGVELIIKLGKLKQLRNLSLTNVKEGQGSALCSSINEMTNLEKLLLTSASGEDLEVIDFPVISCLPMLQKLGLGGKLKKFPERVPHLQSLVKLYLINSQLTDDPLKALQNMPHLLVLHMAYAYEGDILHFQDGGFQKLKQLTLDEFDSLKSIIINKGALVSLERLELYDIPFLKTVPLGIQHLKKLDSLSIYGMSDEFNDCIAPDGGPEHPAIQHVPLVTIDGDYIRRRIVRH